MDKFIYCGTSIINISEIEYIEQESFEHFTFIHLKSKKSIKTDAPLHEIMAVLKDCARAK